MKPMKSSRFGVPVPADVIRPVVALVLMALATWAGVAVGLASRKSIATPAT